ncbi:hypothetical protein CGZ80_09625 [Rhodopirellula sp. MGV]|nr:hypothetical protein CGZ80_09625 [Rhodopirellula sp. MGV]
MANHSRRRFIRNAGCITAAASSVATLGSKGFADDSQRQPGKQDRQAKQIDLGARPSLTTHGAVVVTSGNQTFACFSAESGGGQGLAVIGLKGCQGWKSSAPGENPLDTSDHDTLEACSVFEIPDSTWVDSQSPNGKSDNHKLHHYVITFLGADPEVCFGARHFECLAESLEMTFLATGPFEDVLEFIDYVAADA